MDPQTSQIENELGPGSSANHEEVRRAERAAERAPLLARIAIGLLVVGCLVGVTWGFGSAKNQTPGQLPTSIEAVSPVDNALTVPGQSTISVDLKFGYDADLIIDGVEIPRDQTVYDKATAVVRFTPGPGKDLKLLPGGIRRVMVIYWPLTGTRDANGQSYQWTFTVT
jgi:hypothetical protein